MTGLWSRGETGVFRALCCKGGAVVEYVKPTIEVVTIVIKADKLLMSINSTT